MRIIIIMYQSYKTDYSTESDNGIGYFVSLIQNFITEYVRRAGRMKNRKEASARENWPQEWEHTRPGSARLSQGSHQERSLSFR